MKKILLFTILVAALHVSAQTDSLKNRRVLSFQLDLALLGSDYYLSSQKDFQKYVRDNELLNRDLSGYRINEGFFRTTADFPGYLGIKVFLPADGIQLKKRLKTELFLGFRFGTTQLASAYYSKDSYDTTGTYMNAANNSRLYLVDQFSSSYYYSVFSKHLLLPFGFNLVSNKQKRFWYSVGLEIAPGITFSNKFRAAYDLVKTELVLNEGSKLNELSTFSRSQFRNQAVDHSQKTVPGIGFSGYLNLPLSGYMRLSTRIKFLDRLSIMGSIAPGLWASWNKFTGSRQSLVINLSTGLRYNL